MVVLRLLHIGFGVLWVGAAWMLLVFVIPTAQALGPDQTHQTSPMASRKPVSKEVEVTSIPVHVHLAGLVRMQGQLCSLHPFP